MTMLFAPEESLPPDVRHVVLAGKAPKKWIVIAGIDPCSAWRRNPEPPRSGYDPESSFALGLDPWSACSSMEKPSTRPTFCPKIVGCHSDGGVGGNIAEEKKGQKELVPVFAPLTFQDDTSASMKHVLLSLELPSSVSVGVKPPE